MIKEKMRIVCKRGKYEFLIVDTDNPQIDDKAMIYDKKYNKLSREYTFGQIIKGGYWDICKNDDNLIKIIQKLYRKYLQTS